MENSSAQLITNSWQHSLSSHAGVFSEFAESFFLSRKLHDGGIWSIIRRKMPCNCKHLNRDLVFLRHLYLRMKKKVLNTDSNSDISISSSITALNPEYFC